MSFFFFFFLNFQGTGILCFSFLCLCSICLTNRKAPGGRRGTRPPLPEGHLVKHLPCLVNDEASGLMPGAMD